jgi:hypothetical protein
MLLGSSVLCAVWLEGRHATGVMVCGGGVALRSRKCHCDFSCRCLSVCRKAMMCCLSSKLHIQERSAKCGKGPLLACFCVACRLAYMVALALGRAECVLMLLRVLCAVVAWCKRLAAAWAACTSE